MARDDSFGLFWQDAERNLRLNQKKDAAEKPREKRSKPDPFWERDDYLPGLEESRAQRGITRMGGADWQQAIAEGHTFAWDTETYSDYFAFGVRDLVTDKVDWVEMTPDLPLNIEKLRWIVSKAALVGFNSERYDATMLALAIGGCDNYVLKCASDEMIVQNSFYMEVLKKYRCSRVQFNEHVDLKELAPGIHSLKMYGARLGTKKTQDLPFSPSVTLGADRQIIVRHYMHNDTTVTAELARKLEGETKLRRVMSSRYGVDLMSASDAKIAETVLRTMYERKAKRQAVVPKIDPGTMYRYNVPAYLQFRSPVLQNVLEEIRNAWFIVGESGHIDLPAELRNLKIPLGDSVYKLGIGGLHSTEKTRAHVIYGDDEEMEDWDVESFYPRIILNQRLFPKHLGEALLEVYEEIVSARLDAKHSGDKVTADSLKIVINASFGKFGNKHSVLYSPDFVIQVTLSGQLSLLMLIDALHSAGIRVVSANTDGIVIRCKKSQSETKRKILAWWQRVCGFKLEGKSYRLLASRDVNSYYAVSEYVDKDGNKKVSVKRKGAYAEESLSTTPSANVCADAVAEFLKDGSDIESYIRGCTNPNKFVIVQNVSGGAVWRQQYLGKIARWYWSNAEDRDIVMYAKSGNRVARSDNSRPLMDFTDSMPLDIDYDAYIQHANSILAEIGMN